MLWGYIYARENGVIMVDNNNIEEVDNIAQLRAEYKKLKAENKEFKANAMSNALGSLGLEADKGIGKAVTKLYDGDVTVEAIQEYIAKEFGEVSSSEPTEQDVSENVVQAQNRVEQLNQIGVNAEPVDISQEFAAFINNSETSTRDSINAKLRMMETLKQDKK
jgi:hypothetical protein|tara:strand:+ start:769 stop:1257 length:489 start_codon:yes stop_codon:yes gene_type:complete